MRTDMISLDQAKKIVMKAPPRLATEYVPLKNAFGRILATDIRADLDLPSFDKSAMDGYACRKADVGGELIVDGFIGAGDAASGLVRPGHCVKIMTGASVPRGADCVMIVEKSVRIGDDRVRFKGGAGSSNICRRGEDFKKGDVVLESGARVGAAELAVLASVGRTRVRVSRMPRVGILATGNEVVEPSVKPRAGQLRNSNSVQLCSQVSSAGGNPECIGIASDDKRDLETKIRRGLKNNDILMISGGVSMGDLDLAPGVLKKLGVSLAFEKIAIKPGKPTVFGRKGRKAVFGLPGNPVSTFTIFELLVKPFMYCMMGGEWKPVTASGRLTGRLTRKRTKRISWIPVCFDGHNVTPVDYNGSAHIHAMCGADGMIAFPAGISTLRKGAVVDVLLLT